MSRVDGQRDHGDGRRVYCGHPWLFTVAGFRTPDAGSHSRSRWVGVAMGIQRARSCCCGCSLPTAMKIFAALHILAGIFFIWCAAIPLPPRIEMTQDQRDFFDQHPNYKTVLYIGSAVSLAVGAVFLAAVSSRSLGFAGIAVLANALAIVSTVANMVYAFNGAQVVVLAINVYFCYVVWSFYEMLKEERMGTLPTPAAVTFTAGYPRQ